MSMPFRHSAGFGKRMEYWIAGLMLKEGIDVYMPLIDDNGIDAVIRRPNGTFIDVQIKARSKDVQIGSAGLFAAITHEYRPSYYFIFYSSRMDTFWIISSQEFIDEAGQNKSGKNAGKRSIWLNGKRKNKESGLYTEHCKPQYERYIVTDFSRLLSDEAPE